jgi:fumarylacetoacetase
MVATIDETHDAALGSWIDSANTGDTDFPIQNLPFGVFRRADHDRARIGVAIGNEILDLARAAETGALPGVPDALVQAFQAPALNDLMAADPHALSHLRRAISELLRADSRTSDSSLLVPMEGAELALPVACGDYTDFYASIDHAANVGAIFRPENPLLPNYKYVPIAYHGRSSSLVVSGTPIVRPCGQITGPDRRPAYRPTARLDYEAEIGFILGRGNRLGRPIPIRDAEAHVFGICLVNDWSARDIQAWEYQPLGPFLGKSFATTISPWVVTLEALAPFRRAPRERAPEDPAPLAHLQSPENTAFGAIDAEVEVFVGSARMRAAGMAPLRVSRGSVRELYWTMAQMVAHQTSNGCNLRTGDLLASGTVSGAAPGSEGCLLELTRAGAALHLPSGERRTFLEDGDEVVIRGFCERAGIARIGFGDCRGLICASTGHDGDGPSRA